MDGGEIIFFHRHRQNVRHHRHLKSVHHHLNSECRSVLVRCYEKVYNLLCLYLLVCRYCFVMVLLQLRTSEEKLALVHISKKPIASFLITTVLEIKNWLFLWHRKYKTFKLMACNSWKTR